MTVLKKMRSVYLQEVLLKDYKCFHGVNKFSFVLNPAERVLRYPRCTVFLGDNGTGKTNLLKVIANLAPEIRRVDDEEYKKEGKNDIALEVAFGNTTQEEPLHEKAYRPHVVERYTGKGYNAEVIFAFNKGVGQRITNLKFENLYKKKEINGSYEVRDQVKIGYNATTNTIQYDVPSLENVVIYAYGVNRFSDTQNNLKTDNFVDTLFYDDCPLINVNQWLLQLELAKQSKNQGIRARRRISIITDVLRKSNLFPDVQGYDVVVDGDLNTDVLFKTSLGNFHLQDLAYGYQCMFAWVFDFIPMEVSVLVEAGTEMLDINYCSFVHKEGVSLMGETCVKKYKGYFPIRFNWDDSYHSTGNMSIQCHSGGKYNVENYNEFGRQDESYYVVITGHEAKTFIGFRDDADIPQFFKEIEAADTQHDPCDYMKYVSYEESVPGLQVMLPAGTIHSSGRNQVILEIGSLTIGSYTYKMYDYLRLDFDGKQRPIHTHLGELNVRQDRRHSVIHDPDSPEYIVQKPRLDCEGEGWKEYILGENPQMYISLRRLEFDSICEQDTRGEKFHVLTLVDGDRVRIRSVRARVHGQICD